MNILVTGGLGFVGSNLVDYLIDNKIGNVYVVDNLSSNSSSIEYKNIKVKEYYYEDFSKFLLNTELKFDWIFHLGAFARIQPSFENPLETIKNNLYGTSVVCEYCRKNKSKLIYAGTSSAYNGHHQTPYTFAKWGGEESIKMYIKCYNIDAAVCRFFNVYGPREPKEGEYATVIGKFIRQYNNNEHITIVGDGNQSRDFTHVYDIVSGLVKSVQNSKMNGEIIQLGKGNPITINELSSFFNYDKIKHIPIRKGEAHKTVANTLLTETMINWKAEKNLEDYIKENINI
jgi:UDP-glucose 4-epimerase